jgi:hypothetical protein
MATHREVATAVPIANAVSIATTGVRARARHIGLALGLAALLVGPFVGRAAATQSKR